ncbi:MAG: sensor domain-containing diguanylate cyclase [Rhodocyclaceae bacterium]|nr:MAG: sensor domain-containing diguanylate cyclase [Rhodocyclaceae bacterium]
MWLEEAPLTFPAAYVTQGGPGLGYHGAGPLPCVSMDNALTAENQHLRQQLQSLLAEARQNEEKLRRFDLIERRLIGTHSLAEVIQLLLRDFRDVFKLDSLTLLLIDPEYEIARLLEQESRDGAALPGLRLLESGAELAGLYPQGRPYLGSTGGAALGRTCAPEAGIASVALLPLTRQDALIGGLHLGSANAERFSADSSTDFLERLTAIASICLENALNHERLKSVGLTDALTGINNRRYFECRCLEEVALARRTGASLACMFFDLDHFKRINDTLGHQAGDEVLRKAANVIKLLLRSCDIVARYGGEEFVALLPQTTLMHAREIAERIRANIAAHCFEALPGESLIVTASIGVSVLAAEGGDAPLADQAARMIAAADQAVYQAKHGGRNRVVTA